MNEGNYKNKALVTYYSRLVKKGRIDINDVDEKIRIEVADKVKELPDLNIDAERKIDTDSTEEP